MFSRWWNKQRVRNNAKANINSYDLEGDGISSIDYVNIDLEIENMNSWEVIEHTNSIDLYLQ